MMNNATRERLHKLCVDHKLMELGSMNELQLNTFVDKLAAELARVEVAGRIDEIRTVTTRNSYELIETKVSGKWVPLQERFGELRDMQDALQTGSVQYEWPGCSCLICDGYCGCKVPGHHDNQLEKKQTA